MKLCVKPGAATVRDPEASRGKLVHRTVTPEQAALLQRAIANYRKAKKLMKAWERETERLVENEVPDDH